MKKRVKKGRKSKEVSDTRKIVYAILGFLFVLFGLFLLVTAVRGGITGFAIADNEAQPLSGLFGVVSIMLGFFFLSKTRKKKEGQAAMEFLMTYGWAILAAIIVLGILAAFGVFSVDPGPNYGVVSAPIYLDTVSVVSEIDTDADSISVAIQNGGGEDLTIQSITFEGTNGGEEVTCIDPIPREPIEYEHQTLRVGELTVYKLECEFTDGQGNMVEGDLTSGDIVITYSSPNSQIIKSSRGTLKGTVIEINYERCNDGVDNDNDGWIDLADPGCSDTADNDETNTDTGFHCSDGNDNDQEGLSDGNDPECGSWNDPAGESQCSNGIDDDGDDLCDLTGCEGEIGNEDPGCATLDDDNEQDEGLGAG